MCTLWICLAYHQANNTRQKRLHHPFYCFSHTCFSCLALLGPYSFVPLANENVTLKRVPAPILSSCVDLHDCVRIDERILFIVRFRRDIFSRHGGHVILDLLRLYCRYLCLNMSFIGVRALASFAYPHLFLMPCRVGLSYIPPSKIKTRQKRPPHLAPLANED
jgi:hypothetical protein